MAHISKQAARSLIVELALPQVILDIFDGRPPKELRHAYGCPEEYFRLSPEEQAVYAPNVIVPLWDNSNFDILYAYHTQKRRFLSFSVESSTEEILERPTYSWQQFMAIELQKHWERELEEGELRQIARWLDFRYLDDMLKQLDGAALRTFEEHRAWIARFTAHVAAREAQEAT